MERPGLAAAIGCVAASVASLAVFGLLEASVFHVAFGIVAIRCAATAIDSSSPRLPAIATSAFPLAVLAAVGSLRAGDAGLDAVRSANAILGPAVANSSGLVMAALAAAGVAVLVGSPRLSAEGQLARGLEIVGWIVTGLLVATVLVGPSLVRASSILPWTLATVASFALMAIANRAISWRLEQGAGLLSAVALALAVIA